MDLQQETARIFDELFMLTHKELGLLGIRVEPGEVVNKIISPAKDAYLQGLMDLLALTSRKNREESAEGESREGPPAAEPGGKIS